MKTHKKWLFHAIARMRWLFVFPILLQRLFDTIEGSKEGFNFYLMNRRRLFLLVFLSATVLVGIFAISFSSLTAQTINVDEQFACRPADGSASGEFAGTLLPSDTRAKNTDPVNADRTFFLRCFDKKNPENKDSIADSNPATAKVMSGTLSCDTSKATPNSTTLNYTYINGTGVRLLRDGTIIIPLPLPNSGSAPPNSPRSIDDKVVAPSRTYSYTLQSKDSEGAYQTLASTTCATAVQPLPDLTAALRFEGAPTGNANEYYAGKIKLTGTAKNASSPATDNATVIASSFKSSYYYRLGTSGAWSPFPGGENIPLVPGASTLTVGESRDVQFFPWTAGAGEPWYFKMCVDVPLPNGIVTPELAEGEANCAAVGPYTFVARAQASVNLRIDELRLIERALEK